MTNSKLNSTIFEELTPPTLVDTHTPTYPLNTMQVVVRSTIHSITHIIDGICRKYCTIFCNLMHRKHRCISPSIIGFLCFLKVVLWVEGISNDLNDLCRTTAHIFSIVNIGGSNGYIN